MSLRPTDRLGGRKFLVTVLAQAVNAALLMAGHMSDQVYATVFIVSVGAYIAGNVAQHISDDKHGAHPGAYPGSQTGSQMGGPPR